MCIRDSIITEDPSNDDIYRVGCVAHIKQVLKSYDNEYRVAFECVCRAVIEGDVFENEGCPADVYKRQEKGYTIKLSLYPQNQKYFWKRI